MIDAPRSGGPVTSRADLPSTSGTGRQYTRYGPSGAAGTKSTPKAISAKGDTRPGRRGGQHRQPDQHDQLRAWRDPPRRTTAINSSTRSSWNNQVSQTVPPTAAGQQLFGPQRRFDLTWWWGTHWREIAALSCYGPPPGP